MDRYFTIIRPVNGTRFNFVITSPERTLCHLYSILRPCMKPVMFHFPISSVVRCSVVFNGCYRFLAPLFLKSGICLFSERACASILGDSFFFVFGQCDGVLNDILRPLVIVHLVYSSCKYKLNRNSECYDKYAKCT